MLHSSFLYKRDNARKLLIGMALKKKKKATTQSIVQWSTFAEMSKYPTQLGKTYSRAERAVAYLAPIQACQCHLCIDSTL